MKYARLGRTGLEVSRLCFGCMSFGRPNNERPWVLDLDDARPLFRRAWESGINFYDTANVYSQGTSEEITGELLRELAPRQDYVLATKVYGRMREGPNGMGLSRGAILSEIDNSLKRLKTDYVDLYQIHRFDPNVPIEETMEALHDLVRWGKVRYIGASSMFAWQFAKMQHTAELNGWTKFVSMQDQVSLIFREEEREMLPLCRDQGVGVIPWSPQGRGRLTRPWGTETKRAATDPLHSALLDRDSNREVVGVVEAVARERGVSMSEVALSWVLSRPGITAPIVGVTKMQHLEDALSSLELELSIEECARLEAPYTPVVVTKF